MKGNFLVQHTIQQYSKDKKGQARSYIAKYTIGELQLDDLFGWACDVITITALDYIQGYVTTTRKVGAISCLCAFVEGGSILLNKQANIDPSLPAQIDVIGDYIVFKNDAHIGAYVSQGLQEYLRPFDRLIVFYPVNQAVNVIVRNYPITQEDYDNGYIKVNLNSVENIYAYVYRGTYLMQNIEYIRYEDYFIFRNNVQLSSLTSEGITEQLQSGDIVTLIIQQAI